MKSSVFFRNLRFRPFDVATEEGRIAERYRRAALSVVTNFFSKGVGIVLLLLGIRLTLPYLGVERFGIWVTISGLVALLTFLDLGVGNALVNHISKCSVLNEQDSLRQAVSGGLGVILLISCVMSAALLLGVYYAPWERFIKVKDPFLYYEIRESALVFVVFFGLNTFSGGVQRVFAGLQCAYQSNLAVGVAGLISLACLSYAAHIRAGIPLLLAMTLGIQTLVAPMLCYILVRRKLLSSRRIGTAIAQEAPRLFRASGLYLVLQIGAIIGWGADSLIISATIGVAQVAIYSVTQRVFQFVSQPLAMMNLPLWAAYADAKARSETEFIRRTVQRSLAISLFGAIAGVVVIVIWHEWIFRKITAEAIAIPIDFLIVFAFWAIIEACGNAFSMFKNGCSILKPQVVEVVLFCTLAIPLKVFVSEKYGVTGIVAATIVSYSLVNALVYGLVFRRVVFSNISKSPL